MINRQNFTCQSITCSLFIFLVLPASTNYQLRDFAFGSGGGDDSQSANYAALQISGEPGSFSLAASANNQLGSGLIFANQAAVAAAPTFVNDANYYNKLKLTLNPAGAASDTAYAIAISADDFTTTNYVQNDNTVGATLGSEDWQTYAVWGGASGFFVLGLNPNTTYKVKVKTRQGDFTETAWGPTASAATVDPQFSLDIDVAATDTETSPPYLITFAEITPGTVATSVERVWVDISTNAASGAVVSLKGQNGALTSTKTGESLTSSAADLASVSSGFGIQGVSVTQTSGGPLAIKSAYNQGGDSVGQIATTFADIFDSSSAALVSGRGSFILKAKASVITAPADDYTESLVLSAFGIF